MADVFDIGQQVGRQQDGFSAGDQGEDEVLDLAGALGIEAGGRFVENDQIGIVEEGLGEADAAGHALGEAPDGAMAGVREARHVEQLVNARAGGFGGQPEQAGVEGQGFEGRQVGIEVGLFGEIADAALDGGGAGGCAEDVDRAGRRKKQAQDHLDGGGLTGAVGAEQAEDLSAGDIEGDGADGVHAGAVPEVAEGLG